MNVKWKVLLTWLLVFPTEMAVAMDGAEESLRPDAALANAQASYDDARDPFEGFNRSMWEFNYFYVDKYIYRPVAHGYNDYVPNMAKNSLYNVVKNLDEPSSLVNSLLQGKWYWAANAGGRFTINSTIGLLGLIDVADMMGMSRKQDAFPEVLGYYGVPNGPYFMTPFIGPRVTRELASFWVDSLYFPLSELAVWQSIVKFGFKSLHARAMIIDQERLVDNALDPYTFVKNAYLQHVDYQVYDGQLPPSQQEDDALIEQYMLELE